MNELTLFTCEKLKNLKVTKKGCITYFKIANSPRAIFTDSYSSISMFCKGCKTGKKNYLGTEGKNIKEVEKESKICYLFTVKPEYCKSKENNGIFYRRLTQNKGQWEQKRFCTHQCSSYYHNRVKNESYLENY